MKHTLTFETIPETPPIAETVELEFPRFFEDEANCVTTTRYADDLVSTRISGEVSFQPDPFQSVVVRFYSTTEPDGYETVSFSVKRFTNKEPSKNFSYYENGPSCHKPCDEKTVTDFIASFGHFLKSTLGDYLTL